MKEQQQGTDLQQSGQAGDQGNVNRGQVLAALSPQPSQAGVHMLLKQYHQIGAAGLTDSPRQPLLGPGLDKRPAVQMQKLIWLFSLTTTIADPGDASLHKAVTKQVFQQYL